MRIAIIGVSCALGRALARVLDADPAVELILGLDATSPHIPLRKLKFLQIAEQSPADVRASLAETLGQGFLEHWIDSVVWLESPLTVGDVIASELDGLDGLLDALHRAGILRLLRVRETPEAGTVERLDAFLREHPELSWGELRLPVVSGDGSAWQHALNRRLLLVPHRLRSIPVVRAEEAALAARRILLSRGSGTVRAQDISPVTWGDLLKTTGCLPLPSPHRLLRRLIPLLPAAEAALCRGLLTLAEGRGIG